MTDYQREEIMRLKEEYEPKKATKLDELKAMHDKVKTPAVTFACIFGSLSSLVLGTGMCLAMKVIGDMMPLGIVVGVVGIALVCATYPLYKAMLARRKKKYGAKIVELSNEILNA